MGAEAIPRPWRAAGCFVAALVDERWDTARALLTDHSRRRLGQESPMTIQAFKKVRGDLVERWGDEGWVRGLATALLELDLAEQPDELRHKAQGSVLTLGQVEPGGKRETYFPLIWEGDGWRIDFFQFAEALTEGRR